MTRKLTVCLFFALLTLLPAACTLPMLAAVADCPPLQSLILPKWAICPLPSNTIWAKRP